jgi:hypothetical protein
VFLPMVGRLEQNAPLRAESTSSGMRGEPGRAAVDPIGLPMRRQGPRLASRAPEPEEGPDERSNR